MNIKNLHWLNQSFRWLSVWCDEFDVNFGELNFPARFNYPRPQKISKFDGIHDVTSDKYVFQDKGALTPKSFAIIVIKEF